VKVRGQRDLVTIVGVVSSISPGETVDALGEWILQKEYGRQFKAKSIKTVPPSTLEGIEKYLGSGMVKGIGPGYAKKLVAAFGESVFDVIEETPVRLRQVEGIGTKRLERIVKAWKDQKAIRAIMVFLQSHGVSTSKAVRIFKTYGDEAVERVTKNPYELARDIYGIGFKSADLIAGRLGIAKDSLVRARAGLNHVLLERVGDGHCAYPEAELIREAEALLEIDSNILHEGLEAELVDKFVVRESIDCTPAVFLAALHRQESDVAALLKQAALGSAPWTIHEPDAAVAWVEKHIALTLADLQREAVHTALKSKAAVITGGPGTGKSTLTKAIVTILAAKKVRIALCSPTGRAAKRLSECTGMEAKTIHRTLGFDPKKRGFLHGKENPLPIDLLLIDEASMVDVPLMHALLKALPPHAGLLVIGDVDQLPSVGPGAVLANVIESGVMPVVRLTQVFRQAAQSHIIQAAHRINEGLLPKLDNQGATDFFFVEVGEAQEAPAKIIELVQKRIPKKFGFNAVRDVQVLCPMQRGSAGARNLNLELQATLNPNPSLKVERFGYTFAVGDKVMVLQNDYEKEVFNGDMGFIRDMDLEDQSCLIDFDGREVEFDFSELDILQPAYTVTIHKSQGSEYPAVVLPVFMQHFMMLKRNLLYTGVTRGKKLVVVVGQKKALAVAIKASGDARRWTNLTARLMQSG
jgi:exodeoxyribonuclease V alpha subunit